ncbi:MAG: 4Fe-4S ferredoxin [Anaerolinea sp.]|nr:4Fe-4S ferredoxin [Anaerolinea sp.]
MEDLSKCVHCGLCVNACPTYAITGLEVESPRGRIHLARSIEEGRIPLTPAVQTHWELCLQCRACEAVCPSGVPYGRIMEHARAQLDAGAPAGRSGRRLRKLLLRQVVARPRVLSGVLAPVRLYANSPVRGLVRRTGLLRLLGRMGMAEMQLPKCIGTPVRPGKGLAKPESAATTAILFTGCVMGELFGEVHRATARVLARSGVTAEATAGQGCCGALHAHDGDIDFARTLARKNIDALGGGDEPIVVNSAGCGAAMKEYGELLSGDATYRDTAKAFAARVQDVTEFLAQLAPLPGGVFPHRVAYQDACHLAHAQRIRTQPRALLGALQGCELVETAGADMCCGAAGIYSIVQPAMSEALRARKAEQFARHRPDVIATANPGCQMQYNAATREAGIPARVMHVVEVIDEAQRAAGL